MFTFPKSERLRHKTLVDNLFTEGTTIYEYPLRLTFRPLTEQQLEESFKVGVPEGIAPLQLLITVPKKKRRHAVDRVLMRRRIREVWRLNRRPLRKIIDDCPRLRTLSVAIIYMASENISSERISAKVNLLLAKLMQVIRTSPKDENDV